MSRMLDSIARDGLRPHMFVMDLWRNGWNERWSALRSEILSSTAILADNIADYYYAGTPKETWDVMTDFPNLAPPLERFWVEFTPPSKILSGSTVIDSKASALTFGFLCKGLEPQRGVLSANTKWVLSATLFILESRSAIGPICCQTVALNESGKPVEAPGFDKLGMSSGSINLEVFGCPDLELASEATKNVGGLWHTPLLAISFMHCKNVELQDRSIPDKLAKARARRGQPPAFKYKVLLIDPMKKVLRKEAGEGTDLKRSLHICRGHFSHYSTERPLFGKHSGDFWIPQHTRGSADQGIVLKDYKVKPK